MKQGYKKIPAVKPLQQYPRPFSSCIDLKQIESKYQNPTSCTFNVRPEVMPVLPTPNAAGPAQFNPGSVCFAKASVKLYPSRRKSTVQSKKEKNEIACSKDSSSRDINQKRVSKDGLDRLMKGKHYRIYQQNSLSEWMSRFNEDRKPEESNNIVKGKTKDAKKSVPGEGILGDYAKKAIAF